MGADRIIYDVTIYLYATSVLFYFVDFLHRNRRAKRMALLMLCGVWMLQTAFLLLRFMERQFVPAFTLFDTLLFYAWVLVTFSIGFHFASRMPLVVLFVNLAGFTMAAVALFVTPDVTPAISEQLISELLFIHVTFALAAYSLFLLSFLLALLYLVIHFMLKRKRWNTLMRRAPSLSRVEQMMHWGNILGVPLLLLSLILGLIWAYEQAIPNVWLDPKIAVSFLVLFVYGYYIYRRAFSSWSGFSLAVCNAIAFAAVVFNNMISNMSVSFHHW